MVSNKYLQLKMAELKETVDFIKRKGFRQTLEVLSKQRNFETTMRIFYKELNKFSYYNIFLRIKEGLLNKGIIEITDGVKKKSKIRLTSKGVILFGKLKELNNIFRGMKK